MKTEYSNTCLNKPNLIEENNKVKILSDFEIHTDRVIPARRAEVVVPNDLNINEKEIEKTEKYQDLRDLRFRGCGTLRPQ